MPRLLKVLRRWLAIAFLFGVLLIGTVAMLLNTTSGSRFVINRVVAAVPGSLYVDGVAGTLWRTLELRLLSYRNNKLELSADKLELVISWPNLVAGSIVLNSLDIESIDTRSLDPDRGDQEPLAVSMPPLPFTVSVRSGQVGSFIQQRENDDFVIENVSWSEAQIDGQQIQTDTLNFELFDTEFSIGGLDTTLSGDVPIAADVAWRRVQEDWAGTGSVGGSLAEISLLHTLESPVSAETTGTLQLQGQSEPVFDLVTRLNDVSVGSTDFYAVRVQIDGTVDAYELTYTGSILDPRLPSTTITGAATGNRNGLVNGEFEFTSDAYLVYASGPIGWQPALDASLNIDIEYFDPAIVDERAPGALSGNFQFEFETADNWRISAADITGSLLEYSVAATGDVAAADQQIACTGCVINLVDNSEAGVDLTAQIDGSSQGLAAEVSGDFGSYRNITAAGTAQQAPGGFSGTLLRAAVDETYTGRWVLGTPFSFRSDDNGIEIDGHRWLLPEGQVEITRITASPELVSVQATATALPLAAANRFLPEGFRLDGNAFATVDVSRAGNAWSGTTTWRQTDTVLHVDQVGEAAYDLSIPEAVADATFFDGRARLESAVRVDPGVSLRSTATIENLNLDPQIDASIAIEGERWGWVTALFPEIDDLDGDISANLTLEGPLLSPQIGGEASWLNGSVNVPTLNVPIRNVNLNLAIDTNQSASINGTAVAGEGPVTVSGEVDNLFRADRQLELQLEGETAEVINWPEYHLWASPDLSVSGSAGGWDARGELEIPRAEIDIRQLPENAVTISEDVRTADIDYSTSLSRARYSGEARVTLGDAVRVSAFGLDTRLEGELLIRKNPDEELTAEGTVRLVDGEFVAYGQRLEIEEGTLTFTGPLDDPIVDVRAIRTIEDLNSTIVAGLQLTGRAQNISSTIFSEPSMGEADALSYLMIGRPLAEASDSEGNELSGAAVRLGLRQAARITQEIGQSLGLDELTIIGDGGDATALVAGKQFNSRLYARYAYGVFSRLGMIMIRYKLSERLSLEAGAGETQSIDILYTVEKE